MWESNKRTEQTLYMSLISETDKAMSSFSTLDLDICKQWCQNYKSNNKNNIRSIWKEEYTKHQETILLNPQFTVFRY